MKFRIWNQTKSDYSSEREAQNAGRALKASLDMYPNIYDVGDRVIVYPVDADPDEHSILLAEIKSLPVPSKTFEEIR